jgi:hypothetical protein
MLVDGGPMMDSPRVPPARLNLLLTGLQAGFEAQLQSKSVLTGG